MNELKTTTSKIEHFCTQVKNASGVDDAEVTFEQIILYFFPEAWREMKEAMTMEYIRGFNAGSGVK